MYVTWKVDWTPFIDGTWDSSNTETITLFHDPILNLSLGEKRDSFDFKVTNLNGEYDQKFKPEDRIEIYRGINTNTPISNDLIMVGTVQDTPYTKTGNRIDHRVKGYNYSESVARAIVFVDGDGRPIPEVLQEALDSAGNNSSFKVEWDAGNPSVKTDGDPFPGINERFFNRPLRAILEKYSKQQNTEDGFYYWYINRHNKLVWRPQSSATSYDFNLITTPFVEFKYEKDMSNIVNFVIVKGGLDPAGKPIQDRFIDHASANKRGRKFMPIVAQTVNAQSLNQEDVLKSNDGDANVTSRYPESYPFTTTWRSSLTAVVEGVNMVKGQTVTVNSDKQYVGVMRAHVRRMLVDEGKSYVANNKYGRLKVDLEFKPGQIVWGLGDNISMTIPAVDIGSKVLRVTDIQHSTNGDTYSLEEDIGTLE